MYINGWQEAGKAAIQKIKVECEFLRTTIVGCEKTMIKSIQKV